MSFGFSHHSLRCLIDSGIVRPVPVDCHAIDAAIDHIQNLSLDLRGIGRFIADVHVIGAAEPEHQVSENFCMASGIKQ